MILCDTNTFIEFYKNNKQVIDAFAPKGPANMAVSAVTVAELFYGAFNTAELQPIKAHLSSLHQLPLTNEISNIFPRLMEERALSHKLNLPDALIAATALEPDPEVYTLNVKDFRFISNLRLFDPAQ